MMLLNVFTVLATSLLSSALAQSSTISTAPAATHTISVGANGYNFIPNTVNASVGDIIEFRFYPQNHSVARAAYGQPCIPYEYTGAGRTGFWSGFMPTQLVLSDPPLWRVQINDTAPVFFYCSAPDACFNGMVGVINPNETFSFDNQFLFSQNATEEFSPGENPFPQEVSSNTVSRTTTRTPSEATETATAPSTTSATATASSSPPVVVASQHSGLSGGAIAGITIGAVIAAILGAAVVYMCGRQKTMGEILRRSQAPPQHNSYQPASPGVSEAVYPNMQKTGLGSMSDRISGGTPYGPGAETESYRSASPPIDERTGMMGAQNGIMNPGSFGPGRPSPSLSGLGSPGSVGFPSPMYSETHEADSTSRSYDHAPTLIPSLPNPGANAGLGPHELAVPSRSPSNAATTTLDPNSPRPFSYTDSESGYRNRDEKTLNSLASP